MTPNTDNDVYPQSPLRGRYQSKGTFGGSAAINSTSACRECGAVVYDTDAHDRFHNALAEVLGDWRP